MRLFLAIFLPFICFFTIKRPFSGMFCFLLQITMIGWIPAALWASFSVNQYVTDKKLQKALNDRGL